MYNDLDAIDDNKFNILCDALMSFQNLQEFDVDSKDDLERKVLQQIATNLTKQRIVTTPTLKYKI